MTTEEIFAAVRRCAANAFNTREDAIKKFSSQDNTVGWDSLGHLRLIMEVETAFDITFAMHDIPQMTTIDIVCDMVAHQRDVIKAGGLDR